ncbi:SUMF1/EgtB/PvdO family nonheme iron enzyme [Thiothrix fructosivorans]|uniref:SUMF1/EgtB/PvdO family nonheme iron enzyme n=1 Tax=Thiothrix fructosivorans TaxID=111770 RepID=A0A8B0SIL0_9GAMM|nr:SUMF1/EgtB/PvdO family nonheme iron enzyme [Thiothrix fructosivorans]MBO0611557.1 SUMF1/EgtB/PvdO family nonheme iron enzyme [Thiothrix fructosivorans]QTX10775.1 SUMF1/EgtB/PvdO family nonheme iron enzyme [Thiothrix fructosivorans]
MHDIFLSYSTKDRDRLKPLFQALAQQGWSVFWDHQSIHTGENWHRKIEEAINNSRCVVVVWSKHSIQSEWVLEEANKAKSRNVLFPIRIDAIELPFGFGLLQAGDFTGWNGKGDHPAFIELAAQIYGFLGRGSQPLQPPPASKSRMGAVLAGVAAVAVAGGGVYWQQKGGFSAEYLVALVQPAAPVAQPKVVAAPVESKPPVTPPIVEPEVPKSYQLTVKTTPENAAITVDGDAYEAGKVWKSGAYTVKAMADGYKPVEQVVTIKDQDAAVSLTLEAIRYALTINTKPENAKISLSGGVGYSSGILLQPDDYVVKVEADGYQPQEKAFTIAAGDQTLNVELKPIRLEYEPEMVSIPAGTFTMGCVESRDVVSGMDKCDDDEKPTHEVTLNAFRMGKYEVTFDQWDACEQAKVCPHAEYKGLGRGNRPVINVSWYDITQKYIPWLNKETGKTYRLPTEAEWEYAALGGANTAYPWGNAIGKGNVNCDNVSCGDKFEYIAPVGSFAVNGYGLSDMHGNVLEWCQDWYGDYSSSPVSNPKGAFSGTYRVLRGGSWRSAARLVRSANRDFLTPDNRDNDYGFRLVLP